MITSRKQIISLLNDASERYEDLWDILYQMKYGFRDGKPTESFLDFQYQLSEILFRLDGTYHLISQEKKGLISKKSSINQAWFKNRMMVLSHYQDSLERGISIGKCLGDSFAWFFYQNETQLIQQHLSQKEISHLPFGIGGVGELTVVKTLHFIKNHLVIYHGISTFLRLGDVSLVDLSTQQVISLGEIKSRLANDKRIDVTIILKRSPSKSKEKIAETFDNKNFNILPKAKPRFDRQMKQINSSFEESEQIPIGESSFTGDIHIDELNLLYNGVKSSKFISVKVGDGLLLIAYKARQKSFPARILSLINYKLKIKQVEGDVHKIIDKSLSSNMLYYGSIHYNTKAKSYVPLGFMPFFWWPLNPEFIKTVIFQEIMIATIYNPVFFIRKLSASGVVCNQDSVTGKFDVYRQCPDGNKIRVENFSYFIRLIVNNLFREESVIKMIQEMADIVNSLDLDPLCKVEFNLIQEF